jgi:hypothetical protein
VNRTVRGLLQIALWLLTPVVVWAASFSGAWLGAALAGSDIRLLGLGGLLGGGLGFVAWLFVLRGAHVRRGGQRKPPGSPGD